MVWMVPIMIIAPETHYILSKTVLIIAFVAVWAYIIICMAIKNRQENKRQTAKKIQAFERWEKWKQERSETQKKLSMQKRKI